MFMYPCCIIYCESHVFWLNKNKNLLFRRKQNTIIHIEMSAVRIKKDAAIPIYIHGVDEVLSFDTLK